MPATCTDLEVEGQGAPTTPPPPPGKSQVAIGYRKIMMRKMNALCIVQQVSISNGNKNHHSWKTRTFFLKKYACLCMDVRVFWVNTITIILRLFKHASQVKFKLSCNFPPIFIKYWIFHRAIIEIKAETG